MKLRLWAIVALLSAAAARDARGHGTPIHVEVAANQLVVSQGHNSGDGFAAEMYVETNEDGDPLGTMDVPGLGLQTLWEIPGFDIYGMADTSSLSIEVLPRPAPDADGAARWLWYWNPASERVTPAGDFAQFRWLARQASSITITPDGPQPPPLLLADPVAGYTGYHTHSLLAYALDADPAPPAGAYAMFAQLTSAQYAASAPFLLVFNYGVDYNEMLSAAPDMNRAAFLPGDYNHDDSVTPADYEVWKLQYGLAVDRFAPGDGNGDGLVEAADYTVWRNHLGTSFGPGPAGAQGVVPEPASIVLILLAAAALASRCGRSWTKTNIYSEPSLVDSCP